MVEWLTDYLKSQDFTMTPKAIQLLTEHLGNDLSRIVNELEKLTLNIGQRKSITEDDIEKYVGVSKEYNAFEFQDAVAQRNFSKSIKMIQYFESNNKAAPIQLILPTLYAFFSKLYAVYGLGTNDERRIASEVGIPPFLVKNYMAASRNYAYGKVEQILLLIQEYNLKVIGINNADNTDGDLLKELVIKIMDVPAK